jgi:tRNA uridine 5-carboxymethylaminomethyl modification enzyme
VSEQVSEQVQISVKYAGYISRQAEDIERLRRQENTPLPENMDYSVIDGLSNEVKQKLSEARPATLAAASRIQGVTPAAVSLLLVHLKKRAISSKSA